MNVLSFKKMSALCTSLVLSLACGIANADILLMNQIDNGNAFTGVGSGFASQEFEAANAAFHIGVLDDFIYNGEQLIRAEFVGTLFGGTVGVRNWSNVLSYNVEFYSSVAAAGGNLTGDLGSINVAAGAVTTNVNGANADQAHVLISLPNLTLGAHTGATWMSIRARMDFAGGFGQTGVLAFTGAGTPGGLNAFHANPGGGFNFGGVGNTTQQISPGADAAFRLAAIPEPGSATLLLIAGVGMVLRRGRRLV